MEFINYRFYIDDGIHQYNFTVLDCEYILLNNFISNKNVILSANLEGFKIEHDYFTLAFKNSKTTIIEFKINNIDKSNIQYRVDKEYDKEKVSLLDNIDSLISNEKYNVIHNNILYIVEITLDKDIIRLIRIEVDKQKEYIHPRVESPILKCKEKLSTIYIDNKIEIDFHTENLNYIANQISKLNIKYKVEITEINVHGHDIYVPCIVLKTEDFEIIFNEYKPLRVILNENYFSY